MATALSDTSPQAKPTASVVSFRPTVRPPFERHSTHTGAGKQAKFSWLTSRMPSQAYVSVHMSFSPSALDGTAVFQACSCIYLHRYVSTIEYRVAGTVPQHKHNSKRRGSHFSWVLFMKSKRFCAVLHCMVLELLYYDLYMAYTVYLNVDCRLPHAVLSCTIFPQRLHWPPFFPSSGATGCLRARGPCKPTPSGWGLGPKGPRLYRA